MQFPQEHTPKTPGRILFEKVDESGAGWKEKWRDHQAWELRAAAGWCKSCGCGHNEIGYAHLIGCPDREYAGARAKPDTPATLVAAGYFMTTDDGRWIEAPEGSDLSRCTILYEAPR